MLYSSTRSLIELQRCLTEVPKYAYPIQDFKFLVEDAAERNIVLESSECRDVDTFQTAEGVLQQLSQMVVQANPGDVLLFVFSGHGGVNRHGVGFMDLGRADATQEESRTIKATAFRETVDAVLPEGVTLYPIIDSCCGDTTQADAYDDFWFQDDDVSLTQFMFCLIRVIRQTSGNVTNFELVEKVDCELDSIEKTRKKARGPGTKEQHPGLGSIELLFIKVILKPDPGNSQDLFIRSLSALGIDVTAHDIRFVEDNWESPVLGAWGLGWEIWMDGMEITQFTYFQQAGSLSLSPVSVEITYGLERILIKEMSAYYLEHASVDHLQKHFDFFEDESRRLLSSGLAIPAYDQLLKTSHAFNILDARGFVGVTGRARYFGRMRSLARQCAQLWLKTREMFGFPLGFISEPDQSAVPKDVLKAACEKLKDLILQLLERQRLKHGDGTARD
ncbi:glycine--tRNA ligase, chloroplastic/mitochondrial [Trifolium repens]|nr:glycine--tRNA ligase, chloroplastic/mitochondrial [Trifolium repens]